MIILLVILAIIVLILVIPIGASLGYEGGIFSLAARVLFFDIKLLPKKEKPQKAERPKKPKKEKFKKPKKRRPEDKEPKPKPSLEELFSLAKLGLDTLSGFRRKIVINDFMLHFTAADEDPYDAAMTYGYVNTALGVLLPAAERAFDVRKSDVRTAVDFETTEMTIDLRLCFTVTLAKLLGVVIAAGFKFMKIRFNTMKERARREAEAERTDKDGTAGTAEPGNASEPAGQPHGGADEGQHDEDQGDGGR